METCVLPCNELRYGASAPNNANADRHPHHVTSAPPAAQSNTNTNSADLSVLIPSATAALLAQHRQRQHHQQQQQNQQQSQQQSQQQNQNQLSSQQAEEDKQNTPFARALAKVRVQVQTRRLKEKYLAVEWIRLALNLPVDESVINSVPDMKRERSRTGEIATWYEWKFDKSKFTMEEVETKVDRLRRIKIQLR